MWKGIKFIITLKNTTSIKPINVFQVTLINIQCNNSIFIQPTDSDEIANS